MKYPYISSAIIFIICTLSISYNAQAQSHLAVKLKPGDTVGVVATSCCVSEDEIHAAVETFQHWGLQVKTGKTIGKKHLIFSGEDFYRTEDLQEMIDDVNIKAIFIAKGGYGLLRIIDQINFKEFVKHPKLIVGFSDVTILHMKLLKLGFVSIHGIMPFQFSSENKEVAIASLKQLLFGSPLPLCSPPNSLNQYGEANGTIIGGNLRRLCDLLGSDIFPDLTGKILLLEDIDETLRNIDSMFTQLIRSGKFDKLAGLALGHFRIRKNSLGSDFNCSIEKLIKNRLKNYTFPIAFDMPFGHHTLNLAFPHGAPAKLSVKENGTQLSFSLLENP